MSAVSQNYAYRVQGKKNAGKPEPTVTQDRLEKIKRSFGEYLSDEK